VVEAKMLNCGVITKTKLLGAYSEPWWRLNGYELINAIKQQQVKALQLFEKILRQDLPNKLEHASKDVTVILNCYRRPEYLESQIKAIKEQTIQPKEIWLWVNYHEDNKKIDFTSLGVDRVFRNDYNWKFYGRFAGALLARTEYIAMFDDDTIPGNQWLENCFATMKTHEGILGGAGVILKDDKYFGHDRYGWSSQNEEVIEVDLVGHAWFFKTEWLQYLWKERPFTWENGEDIQFSYLAQKYGNIKTYCPPHPSSDRSLHSSLKGYELGVDSKATSATRNYSVFYKQRNACVKNAIDNGWKTRRG
jgi:glycosyltransferase involved in cell wall biosynthesis